MVRIARFRQNTQFATAANDDGPVSVSVTVPNGSSSLVSQSVKVGTSGAPLIYTIRDSVSNIEWSCNYLQFIDTFGETIYVDVRRDSPSTALLLAQPSGPITGTYTFTATIRSFVPPSS